MIDAIYPGAGMRDAILAIEQEAALAQDDSHEPGAEPFIGKHTHVTGCSLCCGSEPGAEGLDVGRLRTAIHNLRWCKDDGIFHAIAHDDEDEDGYRAALVGAYRLAALAETEPEGGTGR